MSLQPENTRHKYTDRDIREDPSLIEAVEEFLRGYQGDFEFLRDAKHTLVHRDTLTIGVARGVLNCMRADPRASHTIPAPKGYEPPPESEAPKPPLNRRKFGSRKIEEEPCIRTVPHYRHAWIEDGKMFNCAGVPFDINRTTFYLPAVIKRSIVISKSGKKIHKTTGEGNVHWHVPSHEYGYGKPVLHVKLFCRYPSWMKDPILLEDIPDIEAIKQLREISLCIHCWRD